MARIGSVRVHRRRIWVLGGIWAMCGLLGVGCSEALPDDGPGSVGPGSVGPGSVGPGSVGPVGPVGGDDEGEPGSGEITTETRPVGDFDRVVFASEGTVIMSQTGAASLSIEADANLQQYLETDLADGVLTISTASDTDIAPSQPIVFRVNMADVSGLELAGAGTISAERLDGTSVAVVLSGAGDISIDDLQANTVTVEHTGVGTIGLLGVVAEQNVVVSGVGEYDGGELESGIARVEASGTGTATIWVTDDLTLTVSESGEVSFYGSPTVNQQVSDSGKTVSLGDK